MAIVITKKIKLLLLIKKFRFLEWIFEIVKHMKKQKNYVK